MYLLLLLAGTLQVSTDSLAAQLRSHYSMLGVSFFIHSIPMVLMLGYMLLRRRRLRLAGAPWYVYLVGVMGMALSIVSAWCVLRLGAATHTAVCTAGQIVTAAVIDHFGWFGMRQDKLSPALLPGYLLVLAGIALVITA